MLSYIYRLILIYKRYAMSHYDFIFHVLCLELLNSLPSARSCLFANIKIIASRISLSLIILCNSVRASSIRSRSAQSTTNIRPCVPVKKRENNFYLEINLLLIHSSCSLVEWSPIDSHRLFRGRGYKSVCVCGALSAKRRKLRLCFDLSEHKEKHKQSVN